MIAVVSSLLVAMTACADDADVPATAIASSGGSQSSSIVGSFSSDDPVAGDQDKIDAVDAEAVVEATAKAKAEVEQLVMADPLVSAIEDPEPGSDEAAIYAVMTGRLRALNLKNWHEVMESCDPRLAKPNTPEKLELLWTQFAAPFAPHMAYNRNNASVRFLKDGSAIMESDLYAYDEPLFPSQDSNAVIDTWVNVDGNWYISNVWCHSGNLRLK